MVDDYCAECHADAHRGWLSSAHRFSSFNNPVYAASVKETRKVVLARDGRVEASQWCAGCHDPVPLFSGAFARADFDTEHDPTSQAGITCTACHAIERVNSTRGNGDYTIGEPRHYPFAFSTSPTLRALSKQLIKAKPAFHRATFLKPLHRTPEFCSTCHKVHIPGALSDYKEFLRGQNHYDSFILSGVSGRGARSFYYPPKAEPRCAGCHMPLRPSRDFGAQPFDQSGQLTIHDHRFTGANTGVPHLRGDADTVRAQQAFLDNVVTLDVFGLREGGTIAGKLIAPLDATAPALTPGTRYLVELVLRTRKVGHHFTQGTADSNEVWVAGHGHRRRRRHRPERGDRAGRTRGPVVPVHEHLHARPSGPKGGPAQRAGHLRPAVRQADSAGRGAGRPLRVRRASRGARAQSPSTRACSTGSSTSR